MDKLDVILWFGIGAFTAMLMMWHHLYTRSLTLEEKIEKLLKEK